MRSLMIGLASGLAAFIFASCNVGSDGSGQPNTTTVVDVSAGVASAPTTLVVSPPSAAGPTTTTTMAAPVVPAPTTTTTSSTTTTTTTLVPTTELELERVAVITGDIAPKSIVANGRGLFFAQNMMYRHTVTVYNRDFELVETISDTVDLAAFDIEATGTSYQGAPVEAAMAAVSGYAYISNYQMYGAGYGRPGDDDCGQGSWDESFVYRIPFATLKVDQVIAVGAVPKSLALTSDGRLLLVTNWCSHDLSVVDTTAGAEVARIPIGRHPRGIAITRDGATAYVAVMGSSDIAIVDLDSFEVGWLLGGGGTPPPPPRHLIMDPTDSFLFATLNGEGRIAKIDLATGEVLAKLQTGSAPRSMTMSADGRSLYVVNYLSDTVSKVDADSMEVIQVVSVASRPIGITFDAQSRQIWVASYSGAISIFQEESPEP